METIDYKEVKYSKIWLSQLDVESYRIDSEFFDAENVQAQKQIKQKTFKKCKNIFLFVGSGKTPKTYSEDGSKTVVRSGDLGRIQFAHSLFLKTDEDKPFALQKNDVLISSIGLGSIGRVSINLIDEGLFTVSEVTVLRDCIINPFYVTVFYNTSFGQCELTRYITGSTGQLHLLPKNIAKGNIPIPTDSFQQKIEDLVLKAYEQKQASENLYRQAEKILLSELGLENWQPQTRKFSLFDVPFEVENSHSLINLNQMLKSDRLDSEYWESKYLDLYEVLLQKPHTLLGSEVTIKSGFPFQSKEFIDDSEGGNDDEPFIRIRDCKPHYIDNETLTRMSAKYINETNAKKAQVNDIVIGMDGIRYFLGSLVSAPAYVNQRVCHISVKYESDITPEYALLIINGMIGQYQLLRKMTIADTVGHIKNTNVANLIIPISNQVEKISYKVREAINNHQSSKNLLSVAKRAVEIYIEQDEKMAEKYILENA